MSRGIPSGSLTRRRGSCRYRLLHALERTAVHGPESAGSAVDFSSSALATAVDTSGGEEPAPQNTAKNCADCEPLLPCPTLSGVSPGGSLRRSIIPNRATPQLLRSQNRVG